MNEALLAAFPELIGEFDKYTSWQDGISTGAFLTYEDILLPYVENAIDKNDTVLLSRVADFIEKLITSDDEYAENVVYVGILEGLRASCDNSKVRDFLSVES